MLNNLIYQTHSGARRHTFHLLMEINEYVIYTFNNFHLYCRYVFGSYCSYNSLHNIYYNTHIIIIYMIFDKSSIPGTKRCEHNIMVMCGVILYMNYCIEFNSVHNTI